MALDEFRMVLTVDERQSVENFLAAAKSAQQAVNKKEIKINMTPDIAGLIKGVEQAAKKIPKIDTPVSLHVDFDKYNIQDELMKKFKSLDISEVDKLGKAIGNEFKSAIITGTTGLNLGSSIKDIVSEALGKDIARLNKGQVSDALNKFRASSEQVFDFKKGSSINFEKLLSQAEMLQTYLNLLEQIQGNKTYAPLIDTDELASVEKQLNSFYSKSGEYISVNIEQLTKGIEVSFKDVIKVYREGLEQLIQLINKSLTMSKLASDTPEDLTKQLKQAEQELHNLNLRKLNFKGSKDELTALDKSLNTTQENIKQLVETMNGKGMTAPATSVVFSRTEQAAEKSKKAIDEAKTAYDNWMKNGSDEGFSKFIDSMRIAMKTDGKPSKESWGIDEEQFLGMTSNYEEELSKRRPKLEGVTKLWKLIWDNQEEFANASYDGLSHELSEKFVQTYANAIKKHGMPSEENWGLKGKLFTRLMSDIDEAFIPNEFAKIEEKAKSIYDVSKRIKDLEKLTGEDFSIYWENIPEFISDKAIKTQQIKTPSKLIKPEHTQAESSIIVEVKENVTSESQGIGGTGTVDLSALEAEVKQYRDLTNAVDELDKKLGEVTTAIGNKTKAFGTEKTEVDSVVNAEIKKLEDLEHKLSDIAAKANIGIEFKQGETPSEIPSVHNTDRSQSIQKAANNASRQSESAKYIQERVNQKSAEQKKYSEDYAKLLDERDVDLLSRARDTYSAILKIEEDIVQLEGQTNTKSRIEKKQSDLEQLRKEYNDVLKEMEKFSDKSSGVYQDWVKEATSMNKESKSRIEGIFAAQYDEARAEEVKKALKEQAKLNTELVASYNQLESAKIQAEKTNTAQNLKEHEIDIKRVAEATERYNKAVEKAVAYDKEYKTHIYTTFQSSIAQRGTGTSEEKIESISARRADQERNKSEKNAVNKYDVEKKRNELNKFIETLREFYLFSDDAIERANKLQEALENIGTKSGLTELKKEIDNFIHDPDLTKLIDEAKEQEKKKISSDKAKNKYIGETVGKLIGFEKNIESGDVANVDEYRRQIQSVRDLLEEIKKYNFGQLATPEDIANVTALKDRVNQLISDLKNNKNFKLLSETDGKTQQKYLGRIGKWLRDNTAAKGTPVYHQFQALEKQFKNIGNSGEIKSLIIRFEQLNAEAEKSGKLGLSFADRWKKSARSLALYLSTFVSFYDIVRYVRNGINTVREYNTALKEMRKVTSDSVSTLKEFQKESFGLAKSVGTTAQQLQQSTAGWLRLGESLDDAKYSAQEANVLFNISEFETVDDATKGLVALSQAYDNLDKRDIVDKLVGVGDNFPIAVNELTEGMQNVASVLQTQGTSIEQAMAMVVAANATMQDVSKSSMGVRTIALRMAGTEAARDELVQMGEDVSDYVIQTKSKKQQIIKDYTAVKSNDYKGVDILDDNGNLKNPYESLKDIAKIYREIQKEDKEAGTNRATALIEELAGKQRSTAAAGLLLNGDILEAAYEQGLNSSGIAQKELEAELDSIDGKLTAIKNTADEFWTNLLDEGVVKDFISFGDVQLRILNSFIDLAGALPGVNGGLTTLMGIAGGALSTKFGVGFYFINKHNVKGAHENYYCVS